MKKELSDLAKVFIVVFVAILASIGACVLIDQIGLEYNYAIIYNKDGTIMVEGEVEKSPKIDTNMVRVVVGDEEYMVSQDNIVLVKKNITHSFSIKMDQEKEEQ